MMKYVTANRLKVFYVVVVDLLGLLGLVYFCLLLKQSQGEVSNFTAGLLAVAGIVVASHFLTMWVTRDIVGSNLRRKFDLERDSDNI